MNKIGRPKKIVLESDIRNAMKNTLSNTEAAKYLGISYNHYKKWSKQYIDSDTKQSLFDLHLAVDTKTGKMKRYVRRIVDRKEGVPLDKILNNEYSRRYPLYRLKHRLFRSGQKAECCENCGFDTRRFVDKNTPLILFQESDDRDDYSLENLKVYCYNCYYLHVGNIFGHKSGFRTERPEIKELKEHRETNIKIDDDGLPTNLEEYEAKGQGNVSDGGGAQISRDDILKEVNRLKTK